MTKEEAQRILKEISSIIAGLAVFLVLAYAGVTYTRQYLLIKSLYRSGLPAYATVVYQDTRFGRGTDRHWLHYEYRVSDASDEPVTYKTVEEVDPNLFEKHPVGSELAILYRPSDPSVSTIQGNDFAANRLLGGGLLFLTATALYSVVLVRYMYISLRRQLSKS